MSDPETLPGGQFGHVTLGVVLVGQVPAPVVAVPLCDLIGQLALDHVTHLKQLIGEIGVWGRLSYHTTIS